MSRGAQGLRVGLFLVVGMAIVLTAIAYVLGGRVFVAQESVQMRFDGSVYGLQVGAPVVFRGVRVGNVSAIGFDRRGEGGAIRIPVTVSLEKGTLARLQGLPPDTPADSALAALVRQGLSAQLSLQSLLTGQLYVDLDLRPGAAPAAAEGEIPTRPTTIQALQQQLEGIDIKATVKDITALAAGARQFVSDPALREAVLQFGDLARDMRRLTAQVQREVGPLGRAAQDTLAQTRQTAERLGQAAQEIARAADGVRASVAADSPLLQTLEKTAREIALTAETLRATASADSPIAQQLEQATQDIGRAARQVSSLARRLERQPDALLRGRAAGAEWPADMPTAPPGGSR